jgi:hypothetical protein
VPAEQGTQLLFLTVQRVARGCDQQLETGLLQAIAQALGGLGKDRVGEVRQQRGHDVAGTARQQAGLLVRHVAAGRQRGPDAHGGVGGHHGRFAQVA